MFISVRKDKSFARYVQTIWSFSDKRGGECAWGALVYVANYPYTLLFCSTLTIATSEGIADAVILEVELVVALKQPFAMNIVSVHFVEHVGIAEELAIVDDGKLHESVVGYSLREKML